jgi:hypothetical protein
MLSEWGEAKGRVIVMYGVDVGRLAQLSDVGRSFEVVRGKDASG